MNLCELPRAPLEGALNVNLFIAGPRNTVLLKKIPRDSPSVLRSIAYEYHFIGFTDKGGRFRRRTPQEQIGFVESAASHGLRVLPPVGIDTGIAYYPFLNQAKTLDDYLPFSPDEDFSRTIFQLFDDLRKAHKNDIVYGDRWSRNILVDPKFGVINVDFDIEISGRPAKELEVAQVAYYTLCAGQDRAIPLLTEILAGGDGWFDFSLVTEFLQKHAIHFLHNPKYGGIEKETEVLVELVKIRKKSHR